MPQDDTRPTTMHTAKLHSLLDLVKRVQQTCHVSDLCSAQHIALTGLEPRLDMPPISRILGDDAPTPSEEQRSHLTRLVGESISSTRSAIMHEYRSKVRELLSVEQLGGVCDRDVEHQFSRLAEGAWARHLHAITERVRRIMAGRSGEADGFCSARAGFGQTTTDLLEMAFSIHDHINTAETAYLARVSGITQDQCRTWFQNRRQRHRNLEKRAAEVGTTPPPPLRGAPHHPRKISALPRRSDPARTQGNGHTGDVKREGGEIAPAPPGKNARANKTGGRERKIKGLPKRGQKKSGNREQVQDDGGAEEVEQGLIVQEGSSACSSELSISTASDGSYGTSPIFDSPIDIYNNQYPTNDVLVPHGLVFGGYSYGFPDQEAQSMQQGQLAELGEEVNRFAGMGFELGGPGQVGQASGQMQGSDGQNQAQAVAAFGDAIFQLNLAYDSSIPFSFPFVNDTNTNIPLLSANIPPTPRGSSTRGSISPSVRSTPSMQSSTGVMDNILDPFASYAGVVGVQEAEAAMEEWARLVSSSDMDVIISTDGAQTGEGEGEIERVAEANGSALEGEEQEEELDLSVLEELQSYIDIPDSPSSSPPFSLPPSYSSSPTDYSLGGASPVNAPDPIESSSHINTGDNSSNANTAGVYNINAVLLNALNANVDFGTDALDLGILTQFTPTVTPQQAQAVEGMNMGMDVDLDMEGNMSMLDLLPFFNEQDTGFGIDLSLLPPVPPQDSTALIPASFATHPSVGADDRAALGLGTPSQPLALPFTLPLPPATCEQLPNAPACATLNYEVMIGSAIPNMANMADAACRREMVELEAAMVGVSAAELCEVLAGTSTGVQPQDEDRQGEQWRYVDPAQGLHSAHIYGAARSVPQGSGDEQQQEQDIGMDVEVEQEQAEPSSPWTPRRIPSNASFTSNVSNTSADSYASYASYTSTASDASVSSSVSAASTSTCIINPAGAHTPAVVLHTPPYEERRYGIFAFGEEEVGAERWKGGRAPTPGEILDAYYA